MVTMLGIGQSAVRLPNSVLIGNGSPSTTERVLVNYEGLINLSLLKIQSVPLRKFGGPHWEMR
jgi:hypothetical protein